MKKIIVLGATGNVGSYVLKYAMDFFKGKYEVIASGRRKTDFFDRFGVKYYSVDLSVKEDFDKLPQNDVHAVIYLAAQIPSYMNGYEPEKYVQCNIIGSYNVLEYCRKAKVDRVLFSTTVFDISLYTKQNGTILTPYMPYNFSYSGDHAVYVITKNTAIEFMKHYYAEYGLKYFIFRFPTIYAYNNNQYYHPNGVKTLRPVYKMIHQAINGEDIELWGNPNYAKDMVHVYDCAQMICKAVDVQKDHSIYNVGTGKPVTMQTQVETIIDVFSDPNHKSKIVYCPKKPIGGGFLMDISNAREELGYEPKYDCKALFEDFKEEMKKETFFELNMNKS